MKRIATLLAALALLALGIAPAASDPCYNYARDLMYAPGRDTEVVTLILDEEKTRAEIELRIPRNFTASLGNHTSGRQCAISLELMWPSMAPAGLVPESQKRIRDRAIGDFAGWRSLTVQVNIRRSPTASWLVPAHYCTRRARFAELPDKPFKLRALDDGRKWPRHIQRDYAYRNMQELTSYPLNAANMFYFVDGDTEQMVRISCTKGAPRCQLHDSINGLETIIFLEADDLANWRTYRDEIRNFLAAHVVRHVPPASAPDPGKRPPAVAECMREMEAIAGPKTQLRGPDGK